LHNKILNRLNRKGFKSYLVGGCVRDLLMDKIPKDYDIVTKAKPEEIKDIFRNEKISEVGKSFKVIIVNGIEVATFRKDRYFGLSDKNVEISYANSLEEDLERRDLTINSMAWYNNKLIDPFNGQKDIKLRQIRFTGNPDNRIYEDPCRILRALRFCCLFNDFYNIHKDSYNSLQKNALLIRHIPPERIRLEILKVMEYKQSSLFFQLLKEFNIIDKIFPSLDAGYYFYDNNYHSETIFLHNMITGDSISNRKPLLKLAGYLHDVGKPYSFNGINFRNHDQKSAELVSKELEDLKFSNDEIKYITTMINNHMVNIEGMLPKNLRKLFTKLYKDDIIWKDLIQLRIADKKANLKSKGYTRQEIKKYILKIYTELNRKPAFSVKDLKVGGHDVMSILNINPGTKVGEILRYLFEKVVEDPELNEREKLINLMEEYYER